MWGFTRNAELATDSGGAPPRSHVRAVSVERLEVETPARRSEAAVSGFIALNASLERCEGELGAMAADKARVDTEAAELEERLRVLHARSRRLAIRLATTQRLRAELQGELCRAGEQLGREHAHIRASDDAEPRPDVRFVIGDPTAAPG